MKTITTIILLGMLILASCKKEKGRNAILTYKAVDGCTWLIQLSNGDLLEPTNLADFNITPYEGKKIDIEYTNADGASICMMGQMVKITSLREK